MDGGSRGERWAPGWKCSPLVPGHLCLVPDAPLARGAVVIRPHSWGSQDLAPVRTTQPSMWSWPGQLPFCVLASSVYEKEKAMKSFLQQVFDVVSLFGKRTLLLQGVCVPERERGGGGEGKRFYNTVLSWVAKVILWLLPGCSQRWGPRGPQKEDPGLSDHR